MTTIGGLIDDALSEDALLGDWMLAMTAWCQTSGEPAGAPERPIGRTGVAELCREFRTRFGGASPFHPIEVVPSTAWDIAHPWAIPGTEEVSAIEFWDGLTDSASAFMLLHDLPELSEPSARQLLEASARAEGTLSTLGAAPDVWAQVRGFEAWLWTGSE